MQQDHDNHPTEQQQQQQAKRKRFITNDNSTTNNINNNNNDDDVHTSGRLLQQVVVPTVSLNELIHPNFDELARQFRNFRIEYEKIKQQQHTTGRSSSSTNYVSIQACITQEFTIALTKALLHVYFNGLSIQYIPINHLCPPVPNRYYFVQWIHNDLLSIINDTERSLLYFDPITTIHREQQLTGNTNSQQIRNDNNNTSMMMNRAVIGLDIGTGSTCTYPLLFMATSHYRNTHMYATDIDAESIQYATANVNGNTDKYKSHIHIIHIQPSDTQQQQQQQQQQENNNQQEKLHTSNTPDSMKIEDDDDVNDPNNNHPDTIYWCGPLRRSYEGCFPLVCNDRPKQIDFCMTNPPFYDLNDPNSKTDEAQPRRDGRQRTAMKVLEGFYPGGEIGFITDIIMDGLYLFLQNRIRNTGLDEQSIISLPPPPPPIWNCSMIGKRTSQIKIQHIIEQVLGYGHLTCTEFGPGQLTRWFVAWTYYKPNIRSPFAHATWNDTMKEWRFTVTNTTIEDVIQRIHDYCSTFPNHKLISNVVSSTSNSASTTRSCHIEIFEDFDPSKLPFPWPGDEALPIRFQKLFSYTTSSVESYLQIRSSQQRAELFVPSQGHFLIDIILNEVQATKHDGSHSVQVHIDSVYRHTIYGMKMIQTIKNQFQSEICRTNRKWRRRPQQQQQQLVLQQQQQTEVSTPMDETC